jgi:ABC-2 type transport system permease protein
VAMGFKSNMAYRSDAIFGIIGFAITNAINLAVMMLMLAPVTSIDGWTLPMMMFLYGYLLIPKGIDHTLSDALWTLGSESIQKGDLDLYFTKPLNTLFSIVSSKFNYEGFGEVLLGVIFMSVFGPGLAINWNINNIIPLIIINFCGVFVFFSIKLSTASIAFKTKRSMTFMSAIYNINEYGKYPLKIYGSVIGNLLLWVLPFGLIAYVPISLLLFPNEQIFYLPTGPYALWIMVAIIVPFTVLYTGLSYFFYKLGVKCYESAGA